MSAVRRGDLFGRLPIFTVCNTILPLSSAVLGWQAALPSCLYTTDRNDAQVIILWMGGLVEGRFSLDENTEI